MSSPVSPTLEDLDAIAELYPHSPKHFAVARAQIQQRADLVRFWDVKPGEKVLEIGCGQGDCTIVLAAAVGSEGSVTAIDPADLNYGSPFTLGQAQAHLRASPLGSRMTFVQSDPVAFLSGSSEHYTTAVLAQCSWYFARPQVLQDILSTLAPRVDRICFSEYSLTASDPHAQPHVLAVFAQAALECRKPVSESNVRTVFSPTRLRRAATDSDLVVEREALLQPPEGMLDGRWEVAAVLSQDFEAEIEQYVVAEREKAVVVAARDAVSAAVDLLKTKEEKVRTMDVWVAVLKSKQ